MSKQKTYIPCLYWMLDNSTINKAIGDPALYHQGFPKVPINKIVKPDKYPNPIQRATVLDILTNFHTEGWWPISVDENFVLRDGQHRLCAAKMMCLEYIDVVMIPEKSLKPAT